MSEPKRLDRVRTTLRVTHYSRATEEGYIRWVVRFVRFQGTRHPAELGAPEVKRRRTRPVRKPTSPPPRSRLPHTGCNTSSGSGPMQAHQLRHVDNQPAQ
jgi:hypothetical protein